MADKLYGETSRVVLMYLPSGYSEKLDRDGVNYAIAYVTELWILEQKELTIDLLEHNVRAKNAFTKLLLQIRNANLECYKVLSLDPRFVTKRNTKRENCKKSLYYLFYYFEKISEYISPSFPTNVQVEIKRFNTNLNADEAFRLIGARTLR